MAIGDLLASGERDVPVWTLDERLKLQRGVMTNVFPTGTKRVYELKLASGRRIEASGNHPFLELDGWQRLDNLEVGDRIAVARREPTPAIESPWSDNRLKLLGHLIGDGCHLARHALQYTTIDGANAIEVIEAAEAEFDVAPRMVHDQPEGRGNGWYQVFLPADFHLTHGRRNPIAEWLDELGLWDKRSGEKFIPESVFSATDDQIALFLRHLWATDGTFFTGTSPKGKPTASIAYSTTSRPWLLGVQRLLEPPRRPGPDRARDQEGLRPVLHRVGHGQGRPGSLPRRGRGLRGQGRGRRPGSCRHRRRDAQPQRRHHPRRRLGPRAKGHAGARRHHAFPGRAPGDVLLRLSALQERDLPSAHGQGGRGRP